MLAPGSNNGSAKFTHSTSPHLRQFPLEHFLRCEELVASRLLLGGVDFHGAQAVGRTAVLRFYPETAELLINALEPGVDVAGATGCIAFPGNAGRKSAEGTAVLLLHAAPVTRQRGTPLLQGDAVVVHPAALLAILPPFRRPLLRAWRLQPHAVQHPRAQAA